MKCENCGKTHNGEYGSGRFCSSTCARGFSTKNKRNEINKKVSQSLTGRKSWVPEENRNTYKFSDEDRSKGGKKTGRASKEKALQEWRETGKLTKPVKPLIMEEQNNKCDICGMDPVWNGKPLVFVLDHIDGNSDNNARENLRCICPHCDSQLPTYKARNTGNGRHWRRQRYAEGKSF